MVPAELVVSKCPRDIEHFLRINKENLCPNCVPLKDYIQVLSNELKSAQIIIQLLQDEWNTSTVDPFVCANIKHHGINNSANISGTENVWTEPHRSRHNSKLPKNTSRHPKQLPLHITRSVSRFEPLSNLQDDAHRSTHDQHPLQRLHHDYVLVCRKRLLRYNDQNLEYLIHSISNDALLSRVDFYMSL
jgi:hypothetical protein